MSGQDVSKTVVENPQQENSRTSETRLRIVLQASMTTAIIGGAGYISNDYAPLREVLRALAPFISLIAGVFADYLVRKHNYNYDEKRYLKYINESGTNTNEADYWSQKLRDHRTNNSVKIEI